MKNLLNIYPYSLSIKIKGLRNYLYTAWIRNFLGKIGHSSIIEKPCRLIGGGNKSISIGNNTCIQAYSVIGCWKKHNGVEYDPSIVIGNNCSIGEYNHLTAVNGIKIGDGLLTGRFVLISDNSHGGLSPRESIIKPSDRQLQSKGCISIGNNVWIGDKVTILGGVDIGNNVIIAANAVVTISLPDNCIAAGVPAKIIKIMDNESQS